MKKVAHGIYEDYARQPPTQGYFKSVGMRGDTKAIGIIRATGSFQSQGHTFGIAILTANADFCATSNWIPC